MSHDAMKEALADLDRERDIGRIPLQSSINIAREALRLLLHPTREHIAQTLLARRGFGFYTDPMEGGQDAYDISCEALSEADEILALFRRNP